MSFDKELQDLENEISKPPRSSMNNGAVQFNPMDALRDDILSFFSHRIKKINTQERLRLKLQQRLEEMIDNNTINFDQILQLYSQISASNDRTAESILNLFRPVPGAPSFLKDLEPENAGGQPESQLPEMTPDTLNKLVHLSRILQHVNQNGEAPANIEPKQ